MQVLEIGCRAGRVTRALAEFFGEVFAVDISREMVRQARRAVEGFPNAPRVSQQRKRPVGRAPALVAPSRLGPRLELDFAFSSMVFQHIPSRDIIESYVRETNRLLRPGALFKFSGTGIVARGSQAGRQLDWSLPFSESDGAAWRSAAASKCATTTARAINTTGSGFLRRGI